MFMLQHNKTRLHDALGLLYAYRHEEEEHECGRPLALLLPSFSYSVISAIIFLCTYINIALYTRIRSRKV